MGVQPVAFSRTCVIDSLGRDHRINSRTRMKGDKV